jgi:gliding motility-associated-like protein
MLVVSSPPTMKFSLLLLLLLTGQVYAQPATPTHPIPPRTAHEKAPASRINSTEICNNNTDDDFNQLWDQDDFACYFPVGSAASCNPSPIIWTCNLAGEIYWTNLATGIEHYVGRTGAYLTDITWAANGKLYGLGGTGIYEIDPNTAVVIPAFTFPPGQRGSNSMTADLNGNLYFSASFGQSDNSIMRMNMTTGETCVVADLFTPKLSSAGDLTFLNDYLYLSCGQNTIAKIDVQTGKTQGIIVTNSTTGAYYGLTTIGDGYLYAADNGKIYRIDATTMTVNRTPVFTFSTPNTLIYGLASYPELCQAPKCPYQTTITSSFKGPFCEGSNVKLWSADAICSRSSVTFTWTLPNGNTIVTDTLLAADPGMYYANYQMTGGVCEKIDSFEVVRAAGPVVNLGKDTGICTRKQITLLPLSTTGLTTFKWQNGATTPALNIASAGWYWLDAGTGCGFTRDSIYVRQKTDWECEISVIIPTAFTPNNDGNNDLFRPVVRNALQYEFKVYNRWGQQVFSTNDAYKGWNGTINGNPQSTGLYIWTCRYLDNNDQVQVQRGTVTLIR